MKGAKSSARAVNLVCLAGSSPAVVTETVWFLAVKKRRTIASLRVITTAHGRERLLPFVQDVLREMAADFPEAAAAIPTFGEDDVLVPRGANGEAIEDTRTVDECERMADLIHETVRKLTAEAHSLHASLAGGRKSMGFALGNAMTLFGRAGDQLTHVLVDERAESCSRFFYPAAKERRLEVDRGPRKGESFDASQVEVQLHEIPWIALRDQLRGSSLPSTHVGMVAEAQRWIDRAPKLFVDFEDGFVTLDGRTLSLIPIRRAILCALVAAHVRGAGRLSESAILERWGMLCVLYERFGGQRKVFFHHFEKGDVVEADMWETERRALRTHMYGLREAIRGLVGERAAALVLPQHVGNKGYGIGLSIDDIETVGLDTVPTHK